MIEVLKLVLYKILKIYNVCLIDDLKFILNFKK